jgi:carboxylesterase type B
VFGFRANGTDAFRGMPYAAPPTGANRFRPPQPVAHTWTTPRDATRFGPSCIQMGSPGTGEKGQPLTPAWNSINLTDSSEDCLFINVYTPAGASAASAERAAGDADRDDEKGGRPVMFYMHAGEFRFGSSNDLESAWPYFDVDHDVVLVTANVRLGLFGFAAMDTLRHRDPSNSTGNYGMQDIRAALHWVQDNIQAFGGDPTRVTIFGESSGGSSVAFHVTSPKSQGLFQRAILESPGVTQYKTWEAMNTNTKYAASILTAAGSKGCAFPTAVMAPTATAAAASPTVPASARDVGAVYDNNGFRTISGLALLGRKQPKISTHPTREAAQNACLANPKCFMVATGPKFSVFKPNQIEHTTIGGDTLVAGNLQNVEIYLGNVSLYGFGNASQFIIDIRLPDPEAAEACLVGASAVDLISINGAPPYDDSFFTDASAPTLDGVELSVPLSELSRSKDALPKNVALLAGANLDEGTEFMMEAPPLACDATDAEFLEWSTKFYGPELGPLVPKLYANPEMPAPLCLDQRHPGTNTSVQWQGAMRSAGDSTMLCPTREMLAASSAWGNDVFWYFFVATPIRSVNMEGIQYYGAFHGAEVPFVFGDQFELSSDGERALSRAMGCYWTNFAATGDPNRGPSDCTKQLGLPPWPTLGEKGTGGGNALVFSNTSMTVRHNLKQEICDTFAKHPHSAINDNASQ